MEPHRARGGCALGDREQFAAERENFLSVAVDEPAEVGKHDGTAAAPVEWLAERRHELLHLRADGGLRVSELLRRAADAAFPGDGVKVAEVMLVEPLDGDVCGFHKN